MLKDIGIVFKSHQKAHLTRQIMMKPMMNTGVGSLSLLQGIFLTQGWNPGLPLCRQILFQLSHKGSPGCRAEGPGLTPAQKWGGVVLQKSSLGTSAPHWG